MNRIIHFVFAIVLIGVAAPARFAHADDAPTKEQLEQAKKAFGEGKALYEEGKLPEAIEKFKESYKLSKKPALLYNIGHTLDQANDKQKALFYYRKFLADAPKDAKERKEVTKRVDEIEKENFEAELNGTTPTTGTGTTPTGTGNTTTTPVKKPEEVKPPVAIKPAGTYSASDFQHQMVEAAPPGKPLDITAFVPEDSGWTVTLYYRGSGDAKFVAKTMKWRYKELVGRIPGKKMAGTFVQYYVEAKDQAGTVVTRSGKSTSPNLINVDGATPPRFYPDFTDEEDATAGGTTAGGTTGGGETHHAGGAGDEDEDPLNKNKNTKRQQPDPDETTVTTTPGPTGNGFTDVGSSKFNKMKWVSTGLAGGLLAGAVVTYILGSQQASNIKSDRDGRMGNTCQAPPCYTFDTYDIDVQNAGQRYNTIYTITMVTGVVAAGVAGYYWYKSLKAKKHGDSRTVDRAKGASSELSWGVAPTLGEGFAGAAAAGSF